MSLRSTRWVGCMRDVNVAVEWRGDLISTYCAGSVGFSIVIWMMSAYPGFDEAGLLRSCTEEA